MANNLNYLQLGTDPVATDEITGVHHQLVKIEFGPAGAVTVVSPTNPLPTAAGISASTAGLTSIFNKALTATVVDIKATSGRLASVDAWNFNTATTFLQFFDSLAAGVVLGTSAPYYVLSVPPGDGSTQFGQVNKDLGFALEFGTAISVAATTDEDGSTAPALVLRASFLFK